MAIAARRIFAAGLIVLSMSGSTLAADLGDGRGRGDDAGYLPPLERGPDLGRWGGFYLGGTLGYGWGEGRTGGDIGAIPFDQSGMLGTVYAGYNWQFGQTVFGLEADLGTGDFTSSEVTAAGTLRTSLNSLGSLRARAGFLMSPALLVYATAGLAWADMDFQIVGNQARSETFLGYQVGLGGELKVSEHVALRLEYIYSGLGTETVIHSGLNNTYEPDFSTVRAGITLKF